MTQHEKVIAIMLQQPNHWWHCEDLVSFGDIFVGYKAQARISELALDYPEMIETRKSSKGNRQYMYLFRSDNSLKFLPTLPVKLRQFVEERMKQKSLPIQKIQFVPRFNENGTVTMVKEVVNI